MMPLHAGPCQVRLHFHSTIMFTASLRLRPMFQVRQAKRVTYDQLGEFEKSQRPLLILQFRKRTGIAAHGSIGAPKD
jgi:hypothetical protein